MKGFLELQDDLRAIYKRNFPGCLEIGGDIADVDEKSLSRLRKQVGPIDAIIGGPPCQGFSLSGKRRVDDPRNVLFKHYLRFVDAVSPKLAILENVRLLTSMKSPTGALVKEDICEEFRKHCYSVQCFEINAKNYGVPQHRERVLFVALRSDLKIAPSLPEWTHADELSVLSAVQPCRTFADACSDLPFLESGGRSDHALHKAVEHPEARHQLVVGCAGRAERPRKQGCREAAAVRIQYDLQTSGLE